MISFYQRKNTFKYDFLRGTRSWGQNVQKKRSLQNNLKQICVIVDIYMCYTCKVWIAQLVSPQSHAPNIYSFFVSWLDFTRWHGISFLFLDIGLNKHILFFHYYFYTWLCILYFTPFFPLNARLLFKLVLYRQINRKCTFYQCAFRCL